MKRLYVQIFEYENTLSVPIETFVVLFVLRYLKKCLKLVLIKRNEKGSRFHVPRSVLDKFEVSFYDDQNQVSLEIQNCIFPAISIADNFYVTGLCAVLRKILKHDSENDEISHKLLGFRGGCLTACAEVSLWTRFCEIDLLVTTNQTVTNSSKNRLSIPPDLTRLEQHLATPVRTHNIYKRRQHLAKELKKLKKTSHPNRESNKSTNLPLWLRDESKLECLKLSDNSDEKVENLIRQLSINLNESAGTSNVLANDHLPQLTHIYAEGADMTLADIIFYPCIHHILMKFEKNIDLVKANIPLVLRWYNLMQLDSNITTAMTDLDMKCDSSFDLSTDDHPINYARGSESLQDNRSQEPSEDRQRSSFTRQTEIDEILDKIQESNIELKSSQNPCNKVGLDWTALPDIVHPSYGELPNSRILRKCQQVENLVSTILEIAKHGDVIVDFCSGGGHLGIVLAYLLPRCRIIMIDNKEESAARAYQRVEALQLTNAVLYQSNLDYFSGHFDIGTSLHACGVATDLVIQRCLDEGAAFVVCPCCYGAVKNNHIVTYPRSDQFASAGITYKDYLVLSHSADQTHINDPKTQQGKRCMELIDTDRLILTSKYGYKSILCTLIPNTCTPKNNLLIGLPQKC